MSGLRRFSPATFCKNRGCYLYPVEFDRYPGICFAVFFSLLVLVCSKAYADSGSGFTRKPFPENFEYGEKRAYAAGDVALSTGLWRLNGCLIGNSAPDIKNGDASLRLKGGGETSMLFDIPGEVKGLRLSYALFGSDKSTAVSILYSLDGGKRWTKAGNVLKVTGNRFATATIGLHLRGPVRFTLRNEGTQRACIDDVEILMADGSAAVGRVSGGDAEPTRDDNLALGNPSDADSSKAQRDNYLIVKPQYALSYNNAKGRPNWVSWHLSTAWRGSARRCNCFESDGSLPHSFTRASSFDYNGGGFDRGHYCPSEDRTGSAEDNAATFLMTNISPQAHGLNQQAWQDLELYARTLASQGNELYIIAGSYGRGGVNRKGERIVAIAHGRVEVPARFWKIMVVLPVGGNDLARISKETRVIAVDMPNTEPSGKKSWTHYRCSVKSIEQATGYRFFKSIPAGIAASLASKDPSIR